MWHAEKWKYVKCHRFSHPFNGQISINRSDLVTIKFHTGRLESDGWIFGSIKEIFPEEYAVLIVKPEFVEKVNNIIQQEIKSVEESDLDTLKSNIQSIEELYNLEYADEIAELEKRESDYENYLESQADSYMDDHRGEEGMDAYEKEEEIISEMFKSFVE